MNKPTLDMPLLRELDNTLAALKPLVTVSRPRSGWIAAIRNALGMNQGQLAARMETTEPGVCEIEQGEIDGNATLAAMERAAAALNCRFVYALVPNDSLEQFLRQRARDIATARAEYVNHHMMLEGQQLDSEALERLIQDDIEESLDEQWQTLWDKRK